MNVPAKTRHAEAGQVEPAAVVEIKLLVLVQQRLRIDGRTEVQAPLRHAADHAGLGSQRQVVQHTFLGRDGTEHLGHADAEVDHAAKRQFEGAAPGNQLALVERQRCDLVDPRASLARVAALYAVP